MGYERQMSARQKALDLAKKRDALEAEMDAILSSLTENGGPGLTGNLVDAEGFPRADIDVMAIRTQRQRFAVLKTDHKAISAEIEKQMHLALAPPANREEGVSGSHAASSSAGPSASPPLPATSQSAPPLQAAPPISSASAPHVAANGGAVPPLRRVPFALVDLVTPGSPAAAADLRLEDKIVSFGPVSLRSFASPGVALGALPGLLREHENRAVEVIVEREDADGDSEGQNLVTLSLTPRRWSGQGLLGCHVVPLHVSQEDTRYRPDVATAVQSRSRVASSHV